LKQRSRRHPDHGCRGTDGAGGRSCRHHRPMTTARASHTDRFAAEVQDGRGGRRGRRNWGGLRDDEEELGRRGWSSGMAANDEGGRRSSDGPGRGGARPPQHLRRPHRRPGGTERGASRDYRSRPGGCSRCRRREIRAAAPRTHPSPAWSPLLLPW
jgi:hypothetical protein